MKLRTIDLSYPLSVETPVYPGDDAPSVDVLSVAQEPTIGRERQLNNSRFSAGLHNGTHIDAPFHFFSDRETIDQVALERCCGPAFCFDLRETERPGIIDAADLDRGSSRLAGRKKVLLYTGWDKHWGRADYFAEHPVLTRAAAERLVEWGVDLVGVDFPSVDRPPFEAHVVLLGRGVLIVENLKQLDQVNETCEFYAVPLPLVGRDASPVRAFATQEGLPEITTPKPADAPTYVKHGDLKELVAAIFAKSGSSAFEAERLAHYLVEANLAGHDSHGVIRVSYYVNYVRNGQVIPNQHASIVSEKGSVIVVEGGSGYGQIVAEEAMQMAIERCNRSGVCVLALRKCGHLGRIGDWPMMAARAGKVSLHFVNTSGFGLLVAPFGGIDRRLSANPIAVGIPVGGHEPVVLDISTCAIAEGKLKVARNKGDFVSSGCIVDADGRPTNDPRKFYADPPGAILPFGGHKGFGLGVVTEILAGALAGNGCSKPGADRLLNGMLAIVVDPDHVPTDIAMSEEIREFVAFVKSSRIAELGGEILMPGESEANMRRHRLAVGVPLDDRTRAELRDTAELLGVSARIIEVLGGAE
jgi:uncharacterized oxidoreductase